MTPDIHMNTDTSATLTDRPLVSAVSIDQRLAEIDAEQARINALSEEKARLLHEKELALAARRKEAILTLPALLQVPGLDEVMVLLRASLTPAKPTPASRPKGSAYSPEVKAQVRQMMEAHTPVAQIAKHMRIGEATLWIWRKHWGLTKTAPKAKVTRMPRRAKAKAPMSAERKAQFISRVKKGDTPVSKLAREFDVSRARAYQIIAAEHLTTPGLLAA